MLGLIDYSDKSTRKREIRICASEIVGMRAAAVLLPRHSGKRAERTLRAAAAELERLGISTVCFSEDFDRRGFFLERGFHEPETRRFLAEKSAEVLLAAGCGTDCAAVLSGMADCAAVAALNRACLRFRCLMVDLGAETAAICSALRKRTGASVIEKPEKGMLKRAGAAAVFRGSGERAFGEDCAVFCVDADMRAYLKGGRVIETVVFDAAESLGRLPKRYDGTQLLAAAFSEAKLRADSTAVKRVSFAGRTASRPSCLPDAAEIG